LPLTDAQVKAEKPGNKRRRISDGGGLLLEVDPAGGKYWIWRHRYPPTKDGKQQDYRIGPYPKFTLKKARQIRDEQRGQVPSMPIPTVRMPLPSSGADHHQRSGWSIAQ
jgi:hypothetical protein